MEQRGVFGIACVYYELACCLCNNGRWQEAMLEVEKLKKLHRTKPLEVTFTGMIMSSMDGGRVHDCISIFQHIKDHFVLDIGIINAILKIYGRNDMFSEARELFEEIKRAESDSHHSLDGFGSSLSPDAHTAQCLRLRLVLSNGSTLSMSTGRWLSLGINLIIVSTHSCLSKPPELGSAVLEVTGYLSHGRLVKFFYLSTLLFWLQFYLLEHAFDTMLEAGEIPHPSVLTELICQALIQHDFERVVGIINTMAHAPFQASEKQLTDLFECNGDRISEESLKELLDALTNTVEDDSDSDDIFSVDQSSNTEDDADSEMFWFSSYASNGDRKANLFTSLEDLTVDMTSDAPAGRDDNFSNHIKYGNLHIEEVELDVPTGKVGNCRNLRFAYEILESWKESRKKDGMFFPFQFGGK
ncbi:hypothetical protein CsSME_00003582 [Camellia sinensis var. sinensis]